ncbi:protein croquemort-like isoform X1 [Anopheles darlingi]|uniref:protein croquemort-like isoform X1 n=1 Tax=Anopheles darlingi TaxID=43151 RepID=UPI0021004D51|nr:protein croquemort-like isoform X1 [Anopheles darlingi]
MGCCSNRSPTAKRLWAVGGAVGTCVFAIALGFLWPALIWSIAKQEFVLEPGTEVYKNWIDPPIETELQIYLWNWTNAQDYRQGENYKPHLEQLGPYTFIEIHERANLEWNDNYTLTFQQRRIWQPVPEKTVGNYETDRVVTINPVLVTVGYALRNDPLLPFVDGIIMLNNLITSPFYDVPVREMIFDGYDDPLLRSLLLLLEQIPEDQRPSIKLPPYDKFGWFYGRNGSETYDGTFQVGTGADHVQNTGVMRLWNGANRTEYYPGACGTIRGTTGEVWPPFGRLRGTPPNVTVFAPDVCSSVTLQYLDEVERYGIAGLRWIGNDRMFDNGVHYEETACQCTAPEEECPVLDNGAMDVSECKFGAPATISYPHFYLANDSYHADITGMQPDPTEHRFEMELEPYTGVPLSVRAQLQVNLHTRNYGLTLLQGIPTVMLPVLWFRQTAALTDELADDIKIILILPYIGVYVAYGIGAIGIVGLILAIYFSVTRWKLVRPDELPPKEIGQ